MKHSYYGSRYTSSQFTRPRDGRGARSEGLEVQEGYFLEVDGDADDVLDGNLSSAPADFEHGRLSGGYYVTYWFFYAYSDGYADVGDHEGDWERVSIQLRNGQPYQIALWRHSCVAFRAWSEVRFAHGHPVV